MGMFDTILVACPRCKTLNEFQTKGGDCVLDYWFMEDAPADALSKINSHAPAPCSVCGALLDFDMSATRPVVVVREASPPEYGGAEGSESGCTRERLVLRSPSKEQLEIKRLRGVLHSIADSQPWEHMDVDKTPELTNWICDTCRKARVGCYPQNSLLSVEPDGEAGSN